MDNHYIAGLNTPYDWAAFSADLQVGGTEEKWKEAYENYYLTRLELRYLHPIKLLQDNGTFQGEGFSIMAILCSLVEFLESTYQGKLYKYMPRGQVAGAKEYSSSKKMFVSFLCNREPFKPLFSDAVAQEFYSSIRCGLLHEASTKNGWRIWAKSLSGDIIDSQKKIVFRDNFENGIRQFIANYGVELAMSTQLQEAFVRKFNSL